MAISQSRLGKQLGLTFSQIQKYEKGTNRVGAGRLYLIGQALEVKPSFFFDGLEDDASQPASGGDSPARRDEFAVLNEAFAAIHDAETRVSVLALVRSLASG